MVIIAPNSVQTHVITPGEPWAITAAMSPRPTVRVAAVDAAGTILNQYRPGANRRIDADQPDRPWAVYLANASHQFELLCFDLDAKGTQGENAAIKDAATITRLLGQVGLGAVVCQSGPTGGRHVWTALKEPAGPEHVATLARLTRHLCPTLDLAPLSNPATGCVRPPGAPHRSGGHSTILSGDLATLTRPQGTQKQVNVLIETIAGLINDEEPPDERGLDKPLPLDRHGRLYLPGPKRALPSPSQQALSEDAACGDASAVLWKVLIGAASARWRYADIAALAPTAPGLEHVRTYRDRSNRAPRTTLDSERVLKRQWDKAVRHVARSPRQIGDDPTFDARAAKITAHIQGVQTRAHASSGRWSQGGGPADWRTLTALSLYALQGLNTTVEADIRRLALTAGIGRETARISLLRLAEDGWITQTETACGPRAAHWKINPAPSIHTNPQLARSQADPRPAGAGSAERNILLTELTSLLNDGAHDLFTQSPGLGSLAGNLYAHISPNPQTTEQLTQHLGTTPTQTKVLLERLTQVGTIVRASGGWQRDRTDHRDLAAKTLGSHGTLEQRRKTYQIERELWAWWQAEQEWMKAPKKTKLKHRPARGQLSLLPGDTSHAYGPHPRTTQGRLDWKEARRIVEQDRNGTAHRRIKTISTRAVSKAA